jgi:hypothetical protein
MMLLLLMLLFVDAVKERDNPQVIERITSERSFNTPTRCFSLNECKQHPNQRSEAPTPKPSKPLQSASSSKPQSLLRSPRCMSSIRLPPSLFRHRCLNSTRPEAVSMTCGALTQVCAVHHLLQLLVSLCVANC